MRHSLGTRCDVRVGGAIDRRLETTCDVVSGTVFVTMDYMTTLDDTARAFLASALEVLRGENVLPTPWFHPFVQVGRDYFGDSLMGLTESAAFESAIAERHPRFGDDVPLGERDYANGYVFSFLEAFIAEVALNGEDLSPDAPSFDRCLDSLVSVIEADSWEVACCREVSNLTTASGEPLDLAGVTVVPLAAPPADHSREAHRAIEAVIPHARSSFARTPPKAWDPPQSIVIARDHGSKPFDVANALSSRNERFLFVARLLYAGTCDSLYEVQGETSLVRRFTPTLMHFRGDTGVLSAVKLLRRTTRLQPQDVERFAGLAATITAAEGEPRAFLLSSFGMAKHKFQMSYHAHGWFEQLVDLSTALEAALSGTDKTDVLLRLRTRASALLATDKDPAGAIFKDIGHLYELRSRLIHGSGFSEKALNKDAKSITTVPDDSMPGDAVAHAVDRLRDLVRRAMLARICLAGCDPPLWNLGEDRSVDAQLADASTRAKWCAAWREVLESFDAHRSVDSPPLAVDFISEADR